MGRERKLEAVLANVTFFRDAGLFQITQEELSGGYSQSLTKGSNWFARAKRLRVGSDIGDADKYSKAFWSACCNSHAGFEARGDEAKFFLRFTSIARTDIPGLEPGFLRIRGFAGTTAMERIEPPRRSA
jgi:hypothetical protein